MQRLVVRNAHVATMDAERREIAGADILIEDGVIAAVGVVDAEGADSIDASGCVVTPGLVNTHHHLYQTLTKAVPAGQDALLFGWLKTLYPIWARMRARGHVRLGAARPRGARALGLHDELRPSLRLPERRAARGHDRGGEAPSASASTRPAAR